MTRKLNYEAGNFAGRQLEFRCQIVSNHHHLKNGLVPMHNGQKIHGIVQKHSNGSLAGLLIAIKPIGLCQLESEGQEKVAKGVPETFFNVFEQNSKFLTLCVAMGLFELSWAFVDDGFLLDQVMPSPKLYMPSTLNIWLRDF